MRKLVYIAILAALLAAGQVFAADVTQVSLGFENGVTVARVTVQGSFQISHQTEIPKLGKGHRMILDIIGATNRLGSYTNLPVCPVQAIRTSQYAVTPEKVTRIVFDVAKAPVYQVNTEGSTITVTLSDKDAAPFSAWSSGSMPTPAAKSAPAVAQKANQPVPNLTASAGRVISDKNKSTEQDRLESLSVSQKPTAPAPLSSVTTKPADVKLEQPKPVIAAPQTTVPIQATPAQAVNNTPDTKTSTPSTATVDKKPAVPSIQIQQALAAKPVQVLKPDKQTISADAPVAPSTTVAVKPETKTTASPTGKPSIPAPILDDGQADSGPLAETTDDSGALVSSPESEITVVKTGEGATGDQDMSANRSTARFRRAPVSSAKIKGTLVAEFPQRLVVKYEAMGNRDPFATLVDDSKTFDTPIEQRVPNVDGLKLVGIIESSRGNTDNRALFEDKNGYSYILTSGDKVQKGYVLRVERDRVYFQIFEYGWSRTVALSIENAN